MVTKQTECSKLEQKSTVKFSLPGKCKPYKIYTDSDIRKTYVCMHTHAAITHCNILTNKREITSDVTLIHQHLIDRRKDKIS